MNGCTCRKFAVTPGCPRHSVLEEITHRRGWWHRFLVWIGR